MKKSFGILMTLLTLLITMQQGIIFLHFKLNQEYIEANYCINKAKPELNCHGKCELKKEIEGTTKKSPSDFVSLYQELKLMKTEVFTFEIPFENSFNIDRDKILNKPNHYHFSIYLEHFKPPII